MVQLSRPTPFLHSRDGVERYELAITAAHFQSGYVRRRRAFGWIESEDDIIELVVRREPAHITAAQHGLQRDRDVARGDAEVFGAISIETDDQFRTRDAKVRIDIHQPGNRPGAIDESIHPVGQRLEIAVTH